MQTQFRFPRSSVLLMIVVFAGVVLTIAKASSVAGDRLGAALRTLLSALFFVLLSTCTTAAVVWVILHIRRRSGVHRLQNVDSSMD
jgi:hypothetical protein